MRYYLVSVFFGLLVGITPVMGETQSLPSEITAKLQTTEPVPYANPPLQVVASCAVPLQKGNVDDYVVIAKDTKSQLTYVVVFLRKGATYSGAVFDEQTGMKPFSQLNCYPVTAREVLAHDSNGKVRFTNGVQNGAFCYSNGSRHLCSGRSAADPSGFTRIGTW